MPLAPDLLDKNCSDSVYGKKVQKITSNDVSSQHELLLYRKEHHTAWGYLVTDVTAAGLRIFL